jgi:hypothetical protein
LADSQAISLAFKAPQVVSKSTTTAQVLVKADERECMEVCPREVEASYELFLDSQGKWSVKSAASRFIETEASEQNKLKAIKSIKLASVEMFKEPGFRSMVTIEPAIRYSDKGRIEIQVTIPEARGTTLSVHSADLSSTCFARPCELIFRSQNPESDRRVLGPLRPEHPTAQQLADAIAFNNSQVQAQEREASRPIVGEAKSFRVLYSGVAITDWIAIR